MHQLRVIIASTRPGRVGPLVGDWFEGVARKHPEFEVERVDLAELALPFLDEPKHPRLREYTKPHTFRWSAIVEGADAFVMVTPEYNYSAPPALTNALDYLQHEWRYKPVAFVSYGGISGGLRSVQMTKLTLTALGMMPIPEAVTVPFITQHLSEGRFVPTELHEKSAQTMLRELARWSTALRVLRQPA